MYIQEKTGEVKDLSDFSVLFDVLQNNTHIVAQYFDIRTQNYFHDVMSPAFGIDKNLLSLGEWCTDTVFAGYDKEPHALLSKVLEEGLSYADCAKHLSD